MPKWQALIGGLLAALAACGGDSAGSAQFETVSARAVLRDDPAAAVFPEEFPVPVGSTAIATAGTAEAMFAFFSSELSGEQVYGTFYEALPDQGWELLACTVMKREPEDIVTITVERGDKRALIAIGYIPDIHPKVTERYSFYVWMLTGDAPPRKTPSGCKPEYPLQAQGQGGRG